MAGEQRLPVEVTAHQEWWDLRNLESHPLILETDH